MVFVNENLVGRCGLYCGSCIIYRAYKDSEQLRQRIAERENCRPEDIRCEGCQTVLANGWDKDEEWGKNCKIVRCSEAKGLDFCYQCNTYPNCEKFRVIYEASLKRGDNLMENLEKIQASKVQEWLKEEDKKWRCQKCGNPTSRHLQECHWCGEKLRKG